MIDINVLIARCGIREHWEKGRRTGRLTYDSRRATAEDIAAAVARVEEIKAHFEAVRAAEEASYAAHVARIDAIPGLREIQHAIADEERWWLDFEASFRDVGGLGVRPKPQYDIEAMKARYPQAAAWLRAEKLFADYSFELHEIGRKALELVEAGEHIKAIALMDEGIAAYMHLGP